LEIKIYIDLLFFTNFYFDAFLLWLTCLLTRQRPKISRLLLAAGFGGLYSILLFFAPKSLLFTVSGKLVSGALMLFICTPAHCLRAFIKHLAVFYTLSLMAGGIVSALLFESGSFLGGASV
jgi:stage II sporulation protein GA (sporulation sigma-E factor processing peptidase)